MRERKLNRLPGYDYSQPGPYFVTLCVKDRATCFGEIKAGQMILNSIGLIVTEEWAWLARQYGYVQLDKFVIMPNHLHGILWINRNDDLVGNGRDRSLRNAKIKPLPQLIGAFKTRSSKLIHQNGWAGFKWQKSYYDHIIRDEKSLNKIREYIAGNPSNWEADRENQP